MYIRTISELNNDNFPRSRDRTKSAQEDSAGPLLFNMERSFILGVAILIVLISFTHGSPINEANEADLVNRDSLLEKLGMELHR